MIRVLNGGPARDLQEAVFFPFDHFNVPLLAALSTSLVQARRRPVPVVRRGASGEVDEHHLRYYGSVVKIDEKYHMWYLGGGDADARWVREFPAWRAKGICYAVSTDGVHWEKPDLGLAEYNGNRHNNLVDLDCAGVVACIVLHEPDEPDPSRRFKMLFESMKYRGRMAVAFSPDGLHWRESDKNPVLPYVLEMSGLVRLGDCYYCNGQAGGMGARMLCTVVSYDFENWTAALNVGHRRDSMRDRRLERSREGPQAHLGASLWDRGNTILGMYGIWNCPTNDRRSVYMDLGLLVTTDALHYHEPVADFGIVPAAEEGDGATPALMQGQGYENVGDKTLFWYSAWREGEVRLATWERDRLGYVSVDERRALQEPHLWTSPFQVQGDVALVSLNVDGISPNNHVSVAVTSERFEPIRGLAADDCVPVGNGLRSAVRWKERDGIAAREQPVRLKIGFGGLRAKDVKLYAAYVESSQR